MENDLKLAIDKFMNHIDNNSNEMKLKYKIQEKEIQQGFINQIRCVELFIEYDALVKLQSKYPGHNLNLKILNNFNSNSNNKDDCFQYTITFIIKFLSDKFGLDKIRDLENNIILQISNKTSLVPKIFLSEENKFRIEEYIVSNKELFLKDMFYKDVINQIYEFYYEVNSIFITNLSSNKDFHSEFNFNKFQNSLFLNQSKDDYFKKYDYKDICAYNKYKFNLKNSFAESEILIKELEQNNNTISLSKLIKVVEVLKRFDSLGDEKIRSVFHNSLLVQALCHYDCSDKNILFDEKKYENKLTFIDLELVSIANIGTDLIITLLFIFHSMNSNPNPMVLLDDSLYFKMYSDFIHYFKFRILENCESYSNNEIYNNIVNKLQLVLDNNDKMKQCYINALIEGISYSLSFHTQFFKYDVGDFLDSRYEWCLVLERLLNENVL